MAARIHSFRDTLYKHCFSFFKSLTIKLKASKRKLACNNNRPIVVCQCVSTQKPNRALCYTRHAETPVSLTCLKK